MEQNKPLADHDNIISYEPLPYPIVYYPSFYGIFFAFRKKEKSPLTLCSCSRAALANYLSIILLHNEDDYIDDEFRYVPEGKLVLDARFPSSLVKKFSRNKGYTPDEILERLNFQPKLCHECNAYTPTYLYSPDAYASSFKQNYGWYINRLSLEWGVYDGKVYFPELCPPEILKLVRIPTVLDGKINRESYRSHHGSRHARLEIRRQHDQIERAMENIVRLRYGHKQIGDAWTNETILYQIICSLFPNATVLRHYRPRFLKGLELDIYLPEKRMGLEYQGIQHYQPFKHWGGQEAFEKLQKRDAIKKELCSKNRVKVIYFDYTEGLSSQYVAEKLKRYLH